MITLRFTKKNKRRGRHLDRISSLPDELLVHVLSFLPTRCAVATSVLSTRWRHLFTLLAVLSFDDAPCFDGGPYDSQYGCRQLKEIDAGQKRRFRKFVKKILESHQLVPVKKFSLVCYGDYDKSDINAWVRFAVQKGVEDLHYQVNVFGDPDDIFTCETLVRLKIIGLGVYLMGVPLSACFPRLKVLHLDDVNIVNYDYVERLFSGCELLEELTLRNCELAELYIDRPIIISTRTLKILRVEYCSLYGLIEIDAPNLTHLTTKYASGIKIVPSWKQACSLAKAELQFLDNTEDSDTYDDFELLKAAAHKVTDLDISASSVELLLMLFGPEETPDFPRLTRLSLSKCPYYAWEHVTSFLDKSPLLENLVFKTGLRRDTDSQLPSNEDLPPFTCHAKVIEVHDFCGSEYSLLNVGHLLKNAGALKKLILRKSYTVDMAEELRICKVLLNLPKASKDCFIELTSPSIP